MTSPGLASDALSALSSLSIGSLKYRLGLLTSRFRANHPLKACAICISKDREIWSTDYWHRAHQLPGVWVCPEHGNLLALSTLKSTGVRRFHWLLPASSDLVQPTIPDPIPTVLIAIAKASIRIATLPLGLHFEATRVANVYRDALRERRIVRDSGWERMLLREAGKQFAQHVAPLRQIAEFVALPASENEAAKEVARLAREPRGGHHPLRHLAVISWLFADVDSFIERYYDAERKALPRPSAGNATACTGCSGHQELRDRLLTLVADGLSVSGASRQIGVDPITGMAWASAAGVRTTKRPSVIKNDIRKRMIAALSRGASKAVAAKIGKVSTQSVTRLLRTEVGLREAWRTSQFENTRRLARRRWSRVISTNPHSGIKACRLVEPAAYAWLHRNDREWLDAQSALISRGRYAGGTRVDWYARDQILASAVARICLALATEQPDKRIKLWQIYQRIPDLRAKLARLDRLPLTRRAISHALTAAPKSQSPM